MDKLVVKELIQQDCNPVQISGELDTLLNNANYRKAMLDNYDELDQRMGTPGASQKTAALIVKYASKK